MDYKRIYADFIKDRRKKELSLAGYTERHHIVPRCLGGGDEPENLIDLTPEDHFFAHLLLAKIHGGRLWAPVAFMVGGTRKGYRPIQSRRRYGWVLRALAKSKSGEGAYQFDRTVYDLEHKDGRRWSGLQSEFPQLGISKPLANMLIKGRVRSAKGWHLAGQPAPRLAGKSHPMYRSEQIVFLHVDGRRFKGTQHDLHLTHGLSKSMVSRLVRGEFRCAKGWYVEGKPPNAKVGRGRRWANAFRQKHRVVRAVHKDS